ncbi:hypothetical protein ACFO0S_08245 [Chryseomicrobium palamuruense]|uniref:Uncharacterized protein n=1 Tax=Chryseomicrobium palamuruense TaxID=682973 RepID=A0ABV8UX74_9BACL
MFFVVTGLIGISISGYCLGAWTDIHLPRDNSWVEVDPERAGKTKVGLISGAIGMGLLAIDLLIFL